MRKFKPLLVILMIIMLAFSNAIVALATTFAPVIEVPDNFPGPYLHLPSGVTLSYLKVDPPTSGTYTFGNFSVDVIFSNDGTLVAFTANGLVYNVFVKGGTGGGGNLYRYENGILTDSNLQTPNGQQISHVEFWFVEPQFGELEITKIIDVSPNIVGTPTIPDFVITVTGPGSYSSSKTFTQTNLIQTWTELVPGVYTISETPGSPWAVTYSSVDVEVVANQKATAGVTNTFVPGSLDVTKVVDLNGVVNPAAIDHNFYITIQGLSYPLGDTKSISISGGTLLWENLIPGNYTVTEGTLGNMWQVAVPAAAVAVPAGGVGVGTVTNTYLPGSLKVVKAWSIPEGFASVKPTSVSVTIVGPSYPGDGDTQILSNENSWEYTWSGLIEGPYVVTEASLGAKWTYVVDATPAVVLPEQLTVVTVTNTYTPQYSRETAWALYNDNNGWALNRLKGVNNWGWGDRFEVGTYKLYAGAGQNDLSKGTEVGTLVIALRTDGKYDVTYTTNISGAHFTEFHLWVGAKQLPERRGTYSSAPGGFNYKYTNRDGVTSHTFTVTKNTYFAAHAVVCIPVIN